VFSSTLHIFKDRNKLADRSERWIDDSMHEMVPCCWRPISELIYFERASANEAEVQDVEEDIVEALVALICASARIRL
jgi:hypothetical protein